MRPNLLWNGKARGHQECRPVYGVKTDDVFAYEVQIRRPETAALIFRTAHGTEVSGKRVEPHIKHVRLLARNRNAPANRSPRNAEVTESAFDEADDFVAPGFRLNKCWILLIKIEKGLLERGELEEVVRFGDRFRGPAAIGTILAGLYVDVGIVVDAVLSGVVARIDVAILAAQPEKPLDGSRVTNFRGANELVGRNAKFVPQGAPLVSHLGDEF